MPKKKSLILDYFKPKKVVEIEEEIEEIEEKIEEKIEKEEKENVFDIVLVDIGKSRSVDIICVKKNMYGPDLKYIAISYRWGELNEQQVETPDYTAHVCPFHLRDLNNLCDKIHGDPDLKDIPYLWIDAISIDQKNRERKKETVLNLLNIYRNSYYILGIPDIHISYLRKNAANEEIIDLVYKYQNTIYNEIYNMKCLFSDSIKDNIKSSISDSSLDKHTNCGQYSFFQKLFSKRLIKKNEELKIKIKKMEDMNVCQEFKRIYQFLAYLLEDWSNRAWVISEYHIAKEKYIKNGTPLKYMFMSLLNNDSLKQPFFSYYFDDDDNNDLKYTINNEDYYKYNKTLTYQKVYNSKTLYQFLKERFMKRSHLDMILSLNSARNEDRFNAILPSWNKYNYIIKNKDTISGWNITDMTSVRLKLYEIMDDLWDKAILLYACSGGFFGSSTVIFPTFASQCDTDNLKIIEKVHYNHDAYKEFEKNLLKKLSYFMNEKVVQIKQFMEEYKMNSTPIWTENLIDIQFEPHHCYLSVKTKSYFIKISQFEQVNSWRSRLSLDDGDEIHEAFLPFFTFAIPGYIDSPHVYQYSTSIYLVGNIKKNKWILINGELYEYNSKHFCSNDYNFNIY